eukprot:29449-Rhodomonas_salina.4
MDAGTGAVLIEKGATNMLVGPYPMLLHLPFGPTLDTTQCLIPDLDSISARLQYYGCGTISWLLRDQQSSSPVVLSSQPLPDPSCPSHLNVPITCLRL